MNIMEAVKISKYFRRKSWGNKDFFLYANKSASIVIHEFNFHDTGTIFHGGSHEFSLEDILATDWEVKE